jgi:hypothetical protein
MLGILISFLPWILLSALSGQGLRVALIVALALSVWTLVRQFRQGNSKFLDTATGVVLALIFIGVEVARWDFLITYMYPIVNAVLTIISLGSLAVGVPFTLQYAREQTPREYWDKPGFLRVNQYITAVWGVNFLLQTVFSVYRHVYGANVLMAMAWVPLTLGAILFTTRFPDWYRQRAFAAATPTQKD